MCSYSDQVIKSLESDNIKKMKEWNKKFIAPYSMNDLATLRGLSEIIDELWENQIKLQKAVKQGTQDKLSVYGWEDDVADSHTTIRQKDQIYSKLYKSEHMKNAGPYARLKFAMDYWCALWFWPIDKADMLPSRSEFLNDMNLILVGTFSTAGQSNMLEYRQLSLFPTEQDEIISKIKNLFPGQNVVDIDNLCILFPRLALVREIAEQNHFMHWELEFADLFQERGGFDLVIGNPPWIKITWNETLALADKYPMFAVKNLSAMETTRHRTQALENNESYSIYLQEYQSMSGQQAFYNAVQNYSDLKGQQTNLYKCFLPQAWEFNNDAGVSSFVHPDGVFDDSKGGILREKLYRKIRRHYQFQNEKKLFPEVANRAVFSLNIYSNQEVIQFESIANLFEASTIDESYDSINAKEKVGGIKDFNEQWNVKGHPDRIIKIGKKELQLFAEVFDDSSIWQQARLPVLHAKQFVEVLNCINNASNKLNKYSKEVSASVMWDETNAQKDGTMKRNVHFPESINDLIYSGPHIGIANPLFQTPQRNCSTHRAYDCIDLVNISKDYLPRSNYEAFCSQEQYCKRISDTPWGEKHNSSYRILTRSMLNLSGERTLYAAIIPPKVTHINTTFSMNFKDIRKMLICESNLISIPFDFLMKITGKGIAFWGVYSKFPLIEVKGLIVRILLLNCLTENYSELWNDNFDITFKDEKWSKTDERLQPEKFSELSSEWKWNIPLRSDYERRQALVEIDVLNAMGLGMNLNQLLAIYRIQFPVLQQYESDTWYDANGRIVFTNNRSLSGVGFDRKEWENVKGAPAGQKFHHTIMDDTMPGGPVERTIEYVAPFNHCDREKDYETAWKFFEEKLKNAEQ